jgi:SOS response associated peptidase (SRAP)
VIWRIEVGVELVQLSMGLSAVETEGRACHQLSIRRWPVSGRPLPGAGVALLRVTGTRSPKSKWRFIKAGEDWFCFAGLWRPMPDGTGEAFTILTTEPGPDVAPIHNRQVVVLDRVDWLAWLDLTRPEAELLRPLSAGSLRVEQVR